MASPPSRARRLIFVAKVLAPQGTKNMGFPEGQVAVAKSTRWFRIWYRRLEVKALKDLATSAYDSPTLRFR